MSGIWKEKAVSLKHWLYRLYWIEGTLGTLIARKKRFGKLVQIGIKQKDNTYLYATADSSHWNDFKAV